jgi:hypothetical protein
MLRALFSMAWRGRSADGVVRDREKPSLRCGCGCDGQGNGGTDAGGVAGNADGRATAGLVAERCGEAEAAGLGHETKVRNTREAAGYVSTDACGREI